MMHYFSIYLSVCLCAFFNIRVLWAVFAGWQFSVKLTSSLNEIFSELGGPKQSHRVVIFWNIYKITLRCQVLKPKQLVFLYWYDLMINFLFPFCSVCVY